MTKSTNISIYFVSNVKTVGGDAFLIKPFHLQKHFRTLLLSRFRTNTAFVTIQKLSNRIINIFIVLHVITNSSLPANVQFVYGVKFRDTHYYKFIYSE